MNTKPVHRWLPATIMAVGFCIFAAPADALPVVNPTPPERTTLVADSCYEKGKRKAQELRGVLASARETTNGCVVVVLIPGKNGQRPRRREIVVPL